MNDFTASNGVKIVLTNGGKTAYAANPDDDYETSLAYLSFDEFVAFREFFQAESDETLGRWRSPAHPGYVVHVHDGGRYVWVSKELGGNSNGAFYRGNPDTMSLYGDFPAVARAYFDAHPEPKPWPKATEGEVWLITYNGAEYPAIFQADMFRDYGGSWDAQSITDARRIYPESS